VLGSTALANPFGGIGNEAHIEHAGSGLGDRIVLVAVAQVARANDARILDWVQVAAVERHPLREASSDAALDARLVL